MVAKGMAVDSDGSVAWGYLSMTGTTTFAPHWSKLIARAWVDPGFKEHFVADPAAVLGRYGIEKIGGRPVAELAGKIDIVDGPVDGHPKPWMEADRLQIPLPPAPNDYDVVDTSSGAAVAAAGGSGGYWEDEVKTTAYGGQWSKDVWVTTINNGAAGGGGSGAAAGGTATKEVSPQSIPSFSTGPSVEGEDDGEADGGADAGAETAEVAGDTAEAAGGADAAADASAAAAALCG